MVSIGIWGWSTPFLNISLLEEAQKRTKTLIEHFFFNNLLLFLLVFCTELFIDYDLQNPYTSV